MTIKEIATKSGLSEATVRRDIRQGYLEVVLANKTRPEQYLLAVGHIRNWLFDRRLRVGGLTLECRDWLERLNRKEAAA
jgi:predicted transcriptional regulator